MRGCLVSVLYSSGLGGAGRCRAEQGNVERCRYRSDDTRLDRIGSDRIRSDQVRSEERRVSQRRVDQSRCLDGWHLTVATLTRILTDLTDPIVSYRTSTHHHLIPPDPILPHHISPHLAASHRIRSKHTASHWIISYHIASYRITSYILVLRTGGRCTVALVDVVYIHIYIAPYYLPLP